MASVKPVKNGYKVTVSNGYDSLGKKITVSKTFTPKSNWSEEKTKSELEKFKVRFEDQVKNGVNIKAEKMTFEKLARLFLEDIQPPEIEKTTYSSYKKICNHRLIPLLGRERITTINGHTIKTYSNQLRKEGIRLDGKPGSLSEGTIKKDVAVISTILSYGVSEGYLSVNPLIYSGKRRSGKKKEKEYQVKYLSIEQTKWLLEAMDSDIAITRKAHTCKRKDGTTYTVKEYTQNWRLDLKWRVCFCIALFTGDRRGENIALTWEDLDFEECTVNIDESTAYADGEVYQKDTKTHSSRVAVVPPFVMDLARQLYAEQLQTSFLLGDQWVGYRGKDFRKNWVFQQWNGKQMNLDSPRHEFKRLIRIYNTNVAQSESEYISEDVTLHDLRHTTASILISNNMDPRSVAGVLGHADATTTLNIYAYFFKTKHREAANIMQDVLLPKKEKIETVAQ